jgi:hypothetical protein
MRTSFIRTTGRLRERLEAAEKSIETMRRREMESYKIVNNLNRHYLYVAINPSDKILFDRPFQFNHVDVFMTTYDASGRVYMGASASAARIHYIRYKDITRDSKYVCHECEDKISNSSGGTRRVIVLREAIQTMCVSFLDKDKEVAPLGTVLLFRLKLGVTH